jgi:hypothetical protein
MRKGTVRLPVAPLPAPSTSKDLKVNHPALPQVAKATTTTKTIKIIYCYYYYYYYYYCYYYHHRRQLEINPIV